MVRVQRYSAAGVAGIVLTAGLMAIAWVSPVHAAGGSVLTTTPISVPLSAAPGTTASTDLHVQNSGTQPLKITVKLQKFRAQGDTGQAAIYPPPAGDPSVEWVHFSKTSFVADPGVWTTVTMTVSLPPSASNGYYYAVLFVPSSPTDKPAGTTNTFKGANAILVLVDTGSKDEQRSLQVESFTSQRRLYEFLPATFSVQVKNNGSIHLAPEGDIYISRSPNGKTIAAIPINKGQGNVLPQSERRFTIQWDDGLPAFMPKRVNGQVVSDGQGKPIQQLRWDFSKPLSSVRFGKYYAHLALVYHTGSRDIPVNSTISFWVIPYKLIILVLLVIVALILLWRLFKRVNRQFWRRLKRGREQG